MINFFVEFLRTSANVFYETAPFLLLGLFLAGWVKILIPTSGVHRLLGKPTWRSALYAALFGLPLPLCSCSVVPLALSLREKGASREASLSFLISTPETSIDTVLLTWGLLGPVMALARPVVAFFNAVFATAVSLLVRAFHHGEDEAPAPNLPVVSSACSVDHADEHANGHCPCGCEDTEYHVVGPAGLWASFKAAVGFGRDRGAVPLRTLARDAGQYAFRELMDDLSLWLVVGVAAAGLISALLPGDWTTRIPGGQFGGMLFMLVIGIPMYVCAVESTPIAAILIAQGLSPGAALVFLIAGPATNLATVILLRQTFGRGFLRIYLASVVLSSLIAGLALNAFLRATGWRVTGRGTVISSSWWWGAVSLVSCGVLLWLVATSLARLDWAHKTPRLQRIAARVRRLWTR